MDVIVEEELEIMADPVQVGERIQAKTGDFYANTCENTNKAHRVMVNANDSSQEPSPFLSDTLDVAQDNKHAPASPGDDEQVYLESLYKSMLKQQEWLSLEIKKIQKSLFEKRGKSSSGEGSKSQKDVIRAAFKDDTAQVAGDRGLLSRHNSEPEAESVDPPLIKRIASQESNERKESQSIGKKRQSRDFEDDQLSLCKPACQPMIDEEVRTNDSVELNKASGDTRQGGMMKSNRSSGRSSFGNMNIGKHPNMSGSCPDLYQQGLSQGAHMPYGNIPDGGYGMDCMMPRSKSSISHPNCGHMGGYIPQQQPMQMQMQMGMPNTPAMFPQYGIQYNGNRMMMMPNQMMGPRYPMMEQYSQYRVPVYHPQTQGQFMTGQRMSGPTGYNPNMSGRLDRCPTSPIPTQSQGKPGFPLHNSNGNLAKCGSPIGEKAAPTVAPSAKDSKVDTSSDEISENNDNKAPKNNEEKNVSASALPDIQDFDLSPEEFDAIFEGFDLPDEE